MAKKHENDANFAAQVPGVLRYHRSMLSDSVRNTLLYKAIKRHVNENTNFLDVGAGTGVWAILAAKLGARRVVAIEIEECLIPIIYKHAQENGVADRIEIIHGDSNDVRLRGRFDVILSELFGTDAFGKRVVDSFADIRHRFLAPGGVLIPQGLAIYAVPVRTEGSAEKLPAKLPVTCDFLRSLKLNYAQTASTDERQRLKFLGKPEPLIRLDFYTIDSAPVLNLSASWNLRNISKANAFAMFTKSLFADGISMDGFESQSWATTVYGFEPFAERAGTLKFDLQMDEQKTIWAASVPSNPSIKPKIQSPAFALARLKMMQQMTPHRRVRPKRTG